jgi:hypothetical protein
MNDLENRVSLACRNKEGTRRATFPCLLVAVIATVVSLSGILMVLANDNYLPLPTNPFYGADLQSISDLTTGSSSHA